MMKINAMAALFATIQGSQLDPQGNDGMRLLQDSELFGTVIPEDYWTQTSKSNKKLDGQVAFMSHHGIYMRSDRKKKYLKANIYTGGRMPDGWAKFKPVSLGKNRVAFEMLDGRYMVCNSDGTAFANSKKIGDQETFSIYLNDDCPKYKEQKDIVCLSFYNEANKKWLTAENSGQVNCNRDNAGAWEKWYFWDKERIGQSKPNLEGRRWGDKDRKKDKKKDEKDGKKGGKDKEGKKDKKKDGRDRKGKKGDLDFNGNATIDFELANIGNVTVGYENDFYNGRVDMPGDQNDFVWNYRRSGAAVLVASTMAAANVAMYLF